MWIGIYRTSLLISDDLLIVSAVERLKNWEEHNPMQLSTTNLGRRRRYLLLNGKNQYARKKRQTYKGNVRQAVQSVQAYTSIHTYIHTYTCIRTRTSYDPLPLRIFTLLRALCPLVPDLPGVHCILISAREDSEESVVLKSDKPIFYHPTTLENHNRRSVRCSRATRYRL